jgi:hypothetical protein
MQFLRLVREGCRVSTRLGDRRSLDLVEGTESGCTVVRLGLDQKLAIVDSPGGSVHRLACTSTYYSVGIETRAGVFVPCCWSSEYVRANGSTLRVVYASFRTSRKNVHKIIGTQIMCIHILTFGTDVSLRHAVDG